MTFRFQADADLNAKIVRGVQKREPAIDFRGAAGVIQDSTPDPEVLRVAADSGRVLVSGGLKTMRVHFTEFVLHRDSPGVLLVPSTRSIGAAIDGLIIVWLTWSPEELRNLIRWLP